MFHQCTALIQLTSHRCVAFVCGQRSWVPPQQQHGVRGQQSGEPSNSHESPNRIIIVSPVEHPHYDLHPALKHPRGLQFHPRNGYFTRHGVLRGPRASPPLDQIRSGQRDSI
jgi:hypothetical protein